jgi:hypothetical protein
MTPHDQQERWFASITEKSKTNQWVYRDNEVDGQSDGKVDEAEQRGCGEFITLECRGKPAI